MLAFFLQGTGKCEKFFLCNALCRQNICHFRLTACDRSCFIQRNDLDFSRFFKGNRCFKEDSVFGAHTVSYHNGNRRCKSKCTRAADNQNRNASCQRITKALSDQKPNDRRDHGNGNYGRNEHSGNKVCDLGNGSFCSGCITDHFYDLGKCGILSHTGSFTFNESRLVDCCCGNHISGFFIYRNTLTGQCRFIDCGSTFQDHTIHRNVLTRTYNKDLTFLYLFNRDVKFLPVSYYNCCFRCQLHQAFQGIGGLTL